MPLHPGSVVADRFVVEKVAGEGGMGVVYRALDRQVGGPVALKLLHRQSAEDVRRFAQEARLLEQPHPALVRLVTHGVAASGEMYLAMEWLEGEDLATRLGRAGLRPDETIALTRRVAEALGVAHERGIVHRDVKPSNLFLPGGDPRAVKLLDFGIARIRGARHTATGVILGTPAYMAPEQARGAHDLDARADVFALGCVLYECLAGNAAFTGEHPIAVLGKVLLEEPVSIAEARPGVPGALADLVSRMLAKRREDRPPNGAAVARELAALEVVRDERPSSTVPQAAAITAGEQRLVSVVLVGSGLELALDRTLPSSDTLNEAGTQARPDGAAASLREVAGRYGARLDELADGSILVTLEGTWAERTGAGTGSSATDQVVLAARCALAIQRAVPDLPMSLCTGVGDVSGRFPVGDVIDRAVALLAPARAGVPIDPITAGLVERHFDLVAGGQPLLLAEKSATDEPRTVLGRTTPFVGRDRDAATIAALFEECLDEPVAIAVLVTGAPGIGKSRLRQELLPRLAAAEPIEPWIAQGEPMTAGSPLALLGRALSGAAGLHAGDPLAVRRAVLRAWVASRVRGGDVDRIAAFLGEIADTPFPDEATPGLASARADAVLMGDQTRRAFEELLAAEAEARAVVIVLDDLQWSDLPTIAHLDSALRMLRDRRIFVLALARPEVHDVFPRLWTERRLQEVRLAELGRRAGERLVRDILGDLDDARVEAIVDAGGGNALFLEELIRAHAAGGSGGDLPPTILAMLQARLAALPPDARRVLRAASVFGQQFWQGGVQALLGGRKAPELGALAGLVEAELVVARGERRFAGQEELAFRHALVREAVYATLTPSDRQLAHRLAAGWLEQVGETDPLVLADHHERGGDGAGAVRLYLAAAEAAFEGSDHAGALACVERGLSCGAAGEERGALRLVQARALTQRGQAKETVAAAAEAVALLREGSPAWLVANGEHVLASAYLGDPGPAALLAERLVAFTPDASTLSAFIENASRTAVQLVYAHDLDRADRLVQAVERARGALGPGSASAEARRLGGLALRERSRGDLGRYLAIWREVVALAEQDADVRKSLLMRTNVGYALLDLGRFEEAEQVLREVLEPATRLDLGSAVANSLSNLGMAVAHQGRLDEALELERRAVATYTKLGNVRLLGGSHAYLSQIHLMRGEAAEAEAQAREAARLLDAAPLLRPLALALQSQALLALGRPGEALDLARAASSEITKLGVVEEGDTLARLALAEALDATGDPTAAAEEIEKARARLLQRASRIADPSHSKSFLERVPHHARTLALAARWVDERLLAAMASDRDDEPTG